MKITSNQLFSIPNNAAFHKVALEIFKYQATHCAVYKEFISFLNINPESITEIREIPFLPVSFFKSHTVLSAKQPVVHYFTSSATTGMSQSQHHVTDITLYEQSYLQAFQHFYGDIQDYCVLALLPSYQERTGSSLIYMVDDLIKKSGHSQSGYFLNNNDQLFETLHILKNAQQKTILIGVTYALLDFAADYKLNFPKLIVMETGGMKGRRKEMVREELHRELCNGFGTTKIHSEYGMTELLSQAYSKGDGIFECPEWMRVYIRDVNDPLSYVAEGKTGGINVIDLANLNSCSFIATQDLGKLHSQHTFEVLGRFDNSDIRGCNLLVQ